MKIDITVQNEHPRITSKTNQNSYTIQVHIYLNFICHWMNQLPNIHYILQTITLTTILRLQENKLKQSKVTNNIINILSQSGTYVTIEEAILCGGEDDDLNINNN